MRAHAEGERGKKVLCNSLPWKRRGIVVQSEARVVPADDLFRLPMADACQRCWRIMASRRGVVLV